MLAYDRGVRAASHQCLSAVSPGRTNALFLQFVAGEIESPVPVGSESGKDAEVEFEGDTYQVSCHQCLSAVSPGRTDAAYGQDRCKVACHQCLSAVSPGRTQKFSAEDRSAWIQSPVPVGSESGKDFR